MPQARAKMGSQRLHQRRLPRRRHVEIQQGADLHRRGVTVQQQEKLIVWP
jgi:hypothetical protein